MQARVGFGHCSKKDATTWAANLDNSSIDSQASGTEEGFVVLVPIRTTVADFLEEKLTVNPGKREGKQIPGNRQNPVYKMAVGPYTN